MADGRCLIEHTLDAYAAVFNQLTVVVSESDKALKQKLADSTFSSAIKIVSCTNANKGMSASIKAGVQAITGADACLVGLADMPYIKSESLRAICEQATECMIVAPISAAPGHKAGSETDPRIGNPVLFDKRFFPDLLQLSGDRGGRPILKQHRASLRFVAVNDEGIFLDVDEPSDIV